MREERRKRKVEEKRDKRECRTDHVVHWKLAAAPCSPSSTRRHSLTHKQPEGERDPEIMKLVLFVEYFLLLGYEAIV